MSCYVCCKRIDQVAVHISITGIHIDNTSSGLNFHIQCFVETAGQGVLTNLEETYAFDRNIYKQEIQGKFVDHLKTYCTGCAQKIDKRGGCGCTYSAF